MKILFYTFLLFCLGLNVNFGFTQSYLVHKYTEENGLANTMVYDVAQDSQGQIWFATQSGVSAYDGMNWQHYGVTARAVCSG